MDLELLRALLYGVSAQRPSHSLYIAGEQLPLEARMGGIFLGFLGGLLLLLALDRARAARPPGGALGLVAWGLVALTGLDGLNAFLFDGRLPNLYAPTTLGRLATGLGAGYGLALLAAPVVSGVVWREPLDHPVVDGVEMLAGLAGLALLGGLLLAAPPPLLWPAALAMLASVLAGFGVGNLYAMVLATGRARAAERGTDLAGPAVTALGLSLLELALLGVLRSWMAGQGVTWGV